jgi:hypothetical protein
MYRDSKGVHGRKNEDPRKEEKGVVPGKRE